MRVLLLFVPLLLCLVLGADGAAIMPDFKWAQRDDRVFLTVDVRDPINVQMSLARKGRRLEVTCEGRLGKQYELSLDLFKAVDVKKTTHQVIRGGRGLFLTLVKKQEGKWKRLLKSKTKPIQLHVDWDLWKEDDAEEDIPAFGGGMGGGMGGGEGGFDMNDPRIQELMQQYQAAEGFSGDDLMDGAPTTMPWASDLEDEEGEEDMGLDHEEL